MSASPGSEQLYGTGAGGGDAQSGGAAAAISAPRFASGRAGTYLVSDAMSRHAFYVPPDATIRTAVELLRVHLIDIVPVVEGGQVIGVLDPLSLCLYDGAVCVREVAMEAPLTVEADLPLSQAAMHMRRNRLRQVPVLRDGEFAGILSERDLLNVWSTSSDSLTGLPVQHQFRRWMAANLSHGREVSILFLDLDGFGKLNKERSHVYGDQVLKSVADVLRESVDPEREFVCRYGGDEFAIGTTRLPGSARDLAEQITAKVRALTINGMPADVGVSVGLAGGRRQQPRPDAHPDATLDDLITRASMASTSAKESAQHIWASSGREMPAAATVAHTDRPAAALPRVILEGYRIGGEDEGMEVSVTLRRGDTATTGSCRVSDGDVSSALANATAKCLQEIAADPVEIRVDDIFQYLSPRGMACVGAAVTMVRGDHGERMVGTVPLVGDVYKTYAKAVLDATNRRLWVAPNGQHLAS